MCRHARWLNNSERISYKIFQDLYFVNKSNGVVLLEINSLNLFFSVDCNVSFDCTKRIYIYIDLSL